MLRDNNEEPPLWSYNKLQYGKNITHNKIILNDK